MAGFHQVLKDIHLHTGLFISPFILIFSISALIMNHDFVEWQDHWQKWFFSVDNQIDRTIKFTPPKVVDTEIENAKDILDQINISGEIAGIFGDSAHMYIPVTKPGYRISIKADLITGNAYIHSKRTSLWKKMIWLHKMPGPHNASIRGNWIKTRIWGSVLDFSVIVLFLSSVTGIMLWYYFKKERIIGLLFLLFGVLSIASLIVGLTLQ